MAGKSDYLELALLDHIYGGPNYTRPATVYLAFFTVTPTDAGGGTEASGGNYSRTVITNNATNFPAASGALGTKTNGVDFLSPISSAAWGQLVAWGLFDASSGGNMLHWAAQTLPNIDGANQRVEVLAGQLTITED